MPIPLGVLAVAGAGGVTPVPPGNAYEWLETSIVGSGGAANVSFSNLGTNYSGTYEHLQLRMALRSTRNAAADSADINFNSNTSDYRWHALRGAGSTPESFDGGAGGSYMQAGLIPGNTNVANNFGVLVVDILDPFNANKNTTIRTAWGMYGSNENFIGLYSGAWFNTSSVTSITIDCTNANFAQYSRFSLYGLRSS
jgi:hypothetical protein